MKNLHENLCTVKIKLREKQVVDLSDSEIERAFKNTCMPTRLPELAKQLRDSGDLTMEIIYPK